MKAGIQQITALLLHVTHQHKESDTIREVTYHTILQLRVLPIHSSQCENSSWQFPPTIRIHLWLSEPYFCRLQVLARRKWRLPSKNLGPVEWLKKCWWMLALPGVHSCSDAPMVFLLSSSSHHESVPKASYKLAAPSRQRTIHHTMYKTHNKQHSLLTTRHSSCPHHMPCTSLAFRAQASFLLSAHLEDALVYIAANKPISASKMDPTWTQHTHLD